ncbi:DNA methyltransferase [Methanolacinia paynteri]|uniref:DNA methyltransferase n=1 Tax=Methanolacinia paynteri TaxID=230356 RepID=UPI00064F608A|nr:DNA methyltransferase [Methanolacinia paynteri]
MPPINNITEFRKEISGFISTYNGGKTTETLAEVRTINEIPCNLYVNEFWTSRQRQASSIHEVSYRACFKPQLPRFFIELLTNGKDVVYDPFTGRGTTIIEAALLGRFVISNDANPLSRILCEPRLTPPEIQDVEKRLEEIEYDGSRRADIDLSMFFHESTLSEIVSLRDYLAERRKEGIEDPTDLWIRMVATNRLTGHSSGFFSVYTLPPNQAVSPESQVKINKKRDQVPGYRDTKKLILKKTKSLLKNLEQTEADNLYSASGNAVFLSNNAVSVPEIDDDSVALTVTSPPFLDIVQYSKDNWLRCWFNSLDAGEIEKKITMAGTTAGWCQVMGDVFRELFRITKPGGWVAFEVGEVRNGKVCLDEHVVPLGINAGFECAGVVINEQHFTKTSNIWGIENRKKGTNTNRIAVFRKPE